MLQGVIEESSYFEGIFKLHSGIAKSCITKKNDPAWNHENSCMVASVNLYFMAKVFNGPLHLFESNQHILKRLRNGLYQF